jgi:hypothetical protein
LRSLVPEVLQRPDDAGRFGLHLLRERDQPGARTHARAPQRRLDRCGCSELPVDPGVHGPQRLDIERERPRHVTGREHLGRADIDDLHVLASRQRLAQPRVVDQHLGAVAGQPGLRALRRRVAAARDDEGPQRNDREGDGTRRNVHG